MKKLIAVIMATYIIYGCGGEIKDVSFAEDIQPIIKENCLDCHNSEAKLGNLNFETFNALMESRYLNRSQSLVIPGEPMQSRFYLVTHSENDFIRMPPPNQGYNRLSDGEIKTIKTWIEEGAKNN